MEPAEIQYKGKRYWGADQIHLKVLGDDQARSMRLQRGKQLHLHRIENFASRVGRLGNAPTFAQQGQ